MAIRQSWYRCYRWAVLAIAIAGTVGAALATSAGAHLKERLRREGRPVTSDDHAVAGETARNIAVVFAFALAAYVLVPWVLERKRTRRTEATPVDAVGAEVKPNPRRSPNCLIALPAVVALGAATASVVTVVDAGHSGAKLVWHADDSRNNRDD